MILKKTCIEWPYASTLKTRLLAKPLRVCFKDYTDNPLVCDINILFSK